MKNIVETAKGVGSFSRLVEAVKAADLADVLSGRGPFTVFAPDDKAFGRMSEGDWKKLLKDKQRLRSILSYHVVRGRVLSSDLSGFTSVNSLLGEDLSVDISKGVKVNGVRVIQPDIVCSNGVIHVIDGILMPARLEKPAPM